MIYSRARLETAYLYLITPARPAAGDLDGFLASVLDAGVDMVQLREKQMEEGELKRFCEIARKRTTESGALFIVNDFVEVAIACGADGVHLGQDDIPVDRARSQLISAATVPASGTSLSLKPLNTAEGAPEASFALIGLSTHSEAQVLAAGDSAPDYIGVGPVFETPTKAGRPAVGLELVRYAAARAHAPFFAIGGIDLSNLSGVLEAGANRVSVLRALTQAQDPAAVAWKMKKALLENQ